MGLYDNIGYQKCIMCGEVLEVICVSSTSNFKGIELDSRPKGMARYAEKNYVHYCPKCGYASFNLEKDLTDGNPEWLQDPEYRVVVDNPDLYADAKKFYLVGLILNKLNEIQRAATAFLRAAWYFTDVSDRESMIKSRKKAIEMLLKMEFTWKNEKSCAILVDCYRQIGDFDGAIKAIACFGLDNVKDEEYKKQFEYEISLCEAKNTSAHSLEDINKVQV